MTFARFVIGLLIVGFWGCDGDMASRESDAQHLLVAARDLEEKLSDLPEAIAAYGKIVADFPGTKSSNIARSRQATLAKAQTLLAGREAVSPDSLEGFYRGVVASAPDYLAALKRLGTIYINQSDLVARSAVGTGIVAMKDNAVAIWERQNALWSGYNFRPIPSDRHWQDELAKQALFITKMLIAEEFQDYERALKVINQGLVFASSIDVVSDAKVYAAFCNFRNGKKEDLQAGITLAKEALAYEFLSDPNRARAYHVIGLCYTYLHDESRDLADLDEAIKALNEAVNIDGEMADAKQLLKGLRQRREQLARNEA